MPLTSPHLSAGLHSHAAGKSILACPLAHQLFFPGPRPHCSAEIALGSNQLLRPRVSSLLSLYSAAPGTWQLAFAPPLSTIHQAGLVSLLLRWLSHLSRPKCPGASPLAVSLPLVRRHPVPGETHLALPFSAIRMLAAPEFDLCPEPQTSSSCLFSTPTGA